MKNYSYNITRLKYIVCSKRWRNCIKNSSTISEKIDFNIVLSNPRLHFSRTWVNQNATSREKSHVPRKTPGKYLSNHLKYRIFQWSRFSSWKTRSAGPAFYFRPFKEFTSWKSTLLNSLQSSVIFHVKVASLNEYRRILSIPRVTVLGVHWIIFRNPFSLLEATPDLLMHLGIALGIIPGNRNTLDRSGWLSMPLELDERSQLRSTNRSYFSRIILAVISM